MKKSVRFDLIVRTEDDHGTALGVGLRTDHWRDAVPVETRGKIGEAVQELFDRYTKACAQELVSRMESQN